MMGTVPYNPRMYAWLRSWAAKAAVQVSPGLSGASVLCYHSIGDNAARSTIAADVFESQVAYVASRFEVIAPSELVRRLDADESVAGCVSITFDDGYADNLTTALPILEKYRVPAGVFVITSLIGKSNIYAGGVQIPTMDAGQLREAHARGLEVLSHTRSHRDLRDVPETDFEVEFEGSRRELEAIVGSPVPRIVAFPKGRSDERVRSWLSDHEWHAFGTRTGIITPSSPRNALERNGVRRDTSISEFKMLLSDGVSIYERLRALR